MLLQLSVENHRCFADETRFTLTASPDKSHPENLLRDERTKLTALKSTLLFGPNAGGKSSLVVATALMREMVLNSAAKYRPDEQLPVEPFRLDPGLERSPSRFEVTFVHEGVRYQYGFSATREAIRSEWLHAFPKGRRQTWFERDPKHKDGFQFGAAFLGDRAQIARLTRPNALFLSTAAGLNHPQATTIFMWFKDKLRFIGGQGQESKVSIRR